MEEPVRVMEIMRSPAGYPKLSPEYTIRQAWEIMGVFYRDRVHEPRNGEHVGLVVDEENRLAGLLTLQSVMKTMDPWIYSAASRVPGGFLEAAGNDSTTCLLPACTVGEVMLPGEEVAVKSTDVVSKALFRLLHNNVGTLPVLNIFQQVIGMVPAGEVFHTLGLRSNFCKLTFVEHDYSRYGVFDDYYADYDELQEKKKEAPFRGPMDG